MEPTKHKHPFAKYAGSIANIKIPKISEEVIKEQEEEFKRIKNLIINSDISWMPSILLNQIESNNGTDKER